MVAKLASDDGLPVSPLGSVTNTKSATMAEVPPSRP
jgi:hypothetical protein